MRIPPKLACGLLVAVCVFATVLRLCLPPQSAATSPVAAAKPDKGSIIEASSSQAWPKTLAHATAAANALGRPGADRPSLRSSYDWSNASILQESLVQIDASGDILLRTRLVDCQNLGFPVLLEEVIVTRPNSAETETILVRSMAAGQLVLFSETEIPRSVAEAAASKLGWNVRTWRPGQRIAVVEATEVDLATVDHAKELLSLGNGIDVSAEPNYLYYASTRPSNDPRFSRGDQWSLNNDDGVDIDAPEGWSVRTDASACVVAIIDTGIHNDHEDLAANIWRNSGEIPGNGKDDDSNGYVDDLFGANMVNRAVSPQDDNGHGTHVAGIIGAVGNNGRGISGVAWKTRLMAIKFLNEQGIGTSEGAVAAIDYALDNGATVINASWGSFNHSSAIASAIARAEAKGIPLIAAAGNNGIRTDQFRHYPSGYENANVISVAAIDRTGGRAYYSNYGFGSVHVFAPGSDILSTWHRSRDAYTELSGTSMAAPVVAGALALTMAQFPTEDLKALRDRLGLTGSRLDKLGPHLCRYGTLVNLEASLATERIPYPPDILETSETEVQAYEGHFATFSVSAISDAPITYQWFHDGGEIVGETKPVLELDAVSIDDEGEYIVKVSNEDASASAQFFLTVFQRMPELELALDTNLPIYVSNPSHWTIVADPSSVSGSHGANAELASGATAELRFLAPAAADVRVSLRKREQHNLSFETSWQLSDFAFGRRAAGLGSWERFRSRSYSQEQNEFIIKCSLQNPLGPPNAGGFSIDSLNVYLADEAPPYLVSQPRSITTSRYNRAFFRAEVDGPQLSYQWYLNGDPVPNGVSDILTIREVSDEHVGAYYLVATNPFGSVVTSEVTLAINDTPVPAVFPSAEASTVYWSGATGDMLEFTKTALGDPPIHYQWYKDDVPIPGQTTPTLRIGPLNPALSGAYTARAWNEHNDIPATSGAVSAHVVDEFFSPRFSDTDRQALTVEEGEALWIFASELQGTPPFAYKWFKDDMPISGEGDYPYSGPKTGVYFAQHATLADAGVYYLEARNKRGVDQSERIEVKVVSKAGNALDAPELVFRSSGLDDDERSVFGQSLVSYDGVNAVEMRHHSDAEGGAYLQLDTEGPINLSFFWRSDTTLPGELTAVAGGSVVATLEESGVWEEVRVHIPAGVGGIRWALLSADGQRIAWIDQVSIISSPVAERQITRDFPALGETVTLSGTIHGDDIAYQWYKGSDPISGATQPVLTFDALQASDAGVYQLRGSNSHGSAATDEFVLETKESLSRLLSPNLDFALSGDAQIASSQIDPLTERHVLNAEIEPEQVFELTTTVTGPGVFLLELSAIFTNATLSVNGAQTPIITDGGRRRIGVSVPSGAATITLRVEHSGTPTDRDAELALYAATLESGPTLLDQTFMYELIPNYEGGDTLPFVRVVGYEPLRLDWYRNGALYRTVEGASSGTHELFAREMKKDDFGSYHCVVTDNQSNSIESGPITIRYAASIAETLDGPVHSVDSNAQYDYDHAEYKFGGSSLVFPGPFETSETRISIQSSDAKVWVRARGFESTDSFSVSDGLGQKRTVTIEDAWSQLEIKTDRFGLSFYLPASDDPDARFWIDGVVPLPSPLIAEHPKHFATYLGGGASFYVNVAGFEQAAYQWRRNGIPIPGATQSWIEIAKVSFSNLGDYDVVVSTAERTAVSRTASLSLTSELASAMGIPEVKITTWGDALWEVDETMWLHGGKSLRSGALEIGQTSAITLTVDGPASWGYYFRGEGGEGDNFDGPNHWIFRNNSAVAEGASSTSGITVREDEQNGDTRRARSWISGIIVSPLSPYSYERWTHSKRASSVVPLAENELLRDEDFDGDGVSNAVEFALNLDPFQSSKLPSFLIGNDEVGDMQAVLFYELANNAEATMVFEASTDLESWHFVDAQKELVESGAEYRSIRATLPLKEPTESERFLRWSLHAVPSDAPSVPLNAQQSD